MILGTAFVLEIDTRRGTIGKMGFTFYSIENKSMLYLDFRCCTMEWNALCIDFNSSYDTLTFIPIT